MKELSKNELMEVEGGTLIGRFLRWVVNIPDTITQGISDGINFVGGFLPRNFQ